MNMRTTIFSLALISLLSTIGSNAQDRTTVRATSSEISDNLDLRAIASLFGEARDLEDFENRLNNPKSQISNLDLNDDNQVDYLRIVEAVDGNVHLIIVQAVLGQDNYQDVATIEVEKDNNNRIQVQVVGDVFMYGQNYIYEPVYVTTPIIYNTFWVPVYRPYCSIWYWNYYPTFFYAWTPFPVFRYRSHIQTHINIYHQYNYVHIRRCNRAVALHQIRRSNYLERTAPNRSFASRNTAVTNRYELDQVRKVKDVSTRTNSRNSDTRSNSVRTNNIVQEPRSTRNNVVRSTANSSQQPRTKRNDWTTIKNSEGTTRSANTQIKSQRSTDNSDYIPKDARNHKPKTIRQTQGGYDSNIRTNSNNQTIQIKENTSGNDRVRQTTNENNTTRNTIGRDRSSETRTKQSTRVKEGSQSRSENNAGRSNNNTSRRE